MEQQLKEYVDLQETEFKEYVFETAFLPNIKETPLKSYDQAVADARHLLDQYFKIYKDSSQKGIKLFYQEAHSDREIAALDRFMAELQLILKFQAGLTQINEKTASPLSNFEEMIDQYDILIDIGKRQIVDRKFEQASCMFSLLAQICPLFSSAWIGWAICEEEQSKVGLASFIYDAAISMLPEDDYLILFAVPFYLRHAQQEKGKSLAIGALDRLKREGKKDSISYQEIEKLLY